jgi:hypothetical protein
MQRELPVLKLEVNGILEVIDPNDDLAIAESNLMTEFSEQPSKFAYYGGLYSDSIITLEKLKSALQQFEAEHELEMRERILSRYGSGERITEAKMSSEFARDPNWQKANVLLLEWRQMVGRLEVLKEAFKQRAQMLWNIGATRRQEMLRLNPSMVNEEQ